LGGGLAEIFRDRGQVPRHAGEVPRAAVDYVVGQVKVDPALWGGYGWSVGRWVQIREESGFREATRDDEDSLIEWLAAEICPVVLNDDDGVRAALLARCRKLSIEPPGRLERILGSARSRFDKGFCAEVVDRLSAESIDRLEELVTGVDLQWNRYVGE
jgi:Domain of unknown function (DUF4158)